MNLCRVSRLSLSYFMGWVGVAQTLFGDPVMALTYLGAVQANVGHLGRDAEAAGRWDDLDTPPPDDMRRPVSALALAGSLGLPRESVRRKVQMLESIGVMVRKGRGFIVPEAIVAREGNVDAIRTNHEGLTVLLNGLAAEGAAGLTPGVRYGVDGAQRLLVRVSSDYVLRLIFDLRAAFGDAVLAGVVFLALVDATMAPAAGEAGQAVRGLSAGDLAGLTGLPRETTRRHINRLQAQGLVGAGRGRLTPLADPLSRPELATAARANETHLRWMVSQLRRAGVLIEAP